MKKHLLIVIAVGLSLSGCSKSPDQLFNSGLEKVKNGEYQEAVLIFEDVIEKFQSDPVAAQSGYELARVYLDHLKDYPAGYKELEKVAANYGETESGKKAVKEMERFPQWLMNKAELAREDSDMKKAITLLKYLVNSFSTSDLAPKAQYLIGDVFNNDLRDFDQAINSYRQVISRFTGSPQEPHAQFMIAYIFANYKNDFDNARKEYQIFLQTYPKHELIPSVKFEMEFLGIDINEIPNLQRITS